MREKIKFISKITVFHVLTYIACGMLFMTVFHYQSALEVTDGMRDTSSIIVMLAPVFQIGRGVLFGIALWLVKGAFIGKKHGWLILWVVLLIIGIFNTPATSPGSIEELIYYESSTVSWNLSFGGMLEILTQTLVFSILVFLFTRTKPKKAAKEA